MALKDEIQGPRGYMKKVRDNYLGATKEMANAAFEKYVRETGLKLTKENILKDIDGTLKKLLIAETSIYNDRSARIMAEVIPYYYQNIFEKEDENYPATSNYIRRMLEIYQKCGGKSYREIDFIYEIFEITAPVIDYISFSQKQSAKTRVGDSLQNHLEKIFEVCGIPYETQKQKDTGGTVMDFVIPNLAAIESAPDQVINIECQTTLKDRFRLTTGKSTKANVKRYLATTTGCGLITERDVNDFSVDKIKEIVMDNNVTLVVFKEVKKAIREMLENHKESLEQVPDKISVVSLKDTEKLIKMCDNKIISFEELIKRDIQSVLVYWDK